METKTAQYGLIGAILAAVISGAIALYIHYDGKSEQKKIAEQEKIANQSKDTSNLTITNVYVPPVNTTMESAFYAEISNNSLNDAKDLEIKINFGEASIYKCETLPVNIFKGQEKFDNSFISFPLKLLQKKEKLHIYCFLSHPVFDSILITGSNLYSSEEFNYGMFKAEVSEDSSGFLTFFKVIATIISVIFLGYFTIVVISLLNKIFERMFD